LVGAGVRIDDVGGGLLRELEPSDRRNVTDRLVLPLPVVVATQASSSAWAPSIEVNRRPSNSSLRIVLCSRSILPVVVGE